MFIETPASLYHPKVKGIYWVRLCLVSDIICCKKTAPELIKYKTCSNGHARPMGESERVKNKNVQGKSTFVYSCCNVGGLGRAYLNASKYVQK